MHFEVEQQIIWFVAIWYFFTFLTLRQKELAVWRIGSKTMSVNRTGLYRQKLSSEVTSIDLKKLT